MGTVSEQEGSIQIRLARLGDDAALAALDAAAWTPQSGFPSVIEAGNSYFFSPDSPPEAHLVAEISHQLAGYLRLKPASRLPENAHVLAITGLAVAPRARRAGVAAALLEAAARRAGARGAMKLSLRVLGTNQAAVRLYEKQGFVREGVQRAEFFIEGQYVDDVLMAKQI
jgi:ribosomal protein S18 acetylase RimI-like enzyme